MKKVFFYIILFLFFNLSFVNAETEIKQDDFSIKVQDIIYYKDIKKTQFKILIDDLNLSEKVNYWKFEAVCDKHMTIQVDASSKNDCGKRIRIDSLEDNSFSFLFDNRSPKLKNFYIKLKAYSYNGKFIYGDRMGFGWK